MRSRTLQATGNALAMYFQTRLGHCAASPEAFSPSCETTLVLQPKPEFQENGANGPLPNKGPAAKPL